MILHLARMSLVCLIFLLSIVDFHESSAEHYMARTLAFWLVVVVSGVRDPAARSLAVVGWVTTLLLVALGRLGGRWIPSQIVTLYGAAIVFSAAGFMPLRARLVGPIAAAIPVLLVCGSQPAAACVAASGLLLPDSSESTADKRPFASLGTVLGATWFVLTIVSVIRRTWPFASIFTGACDHVLDLVAASPSEFSTN